MICIICDNEKANCYVTIKNKYFCEECLKSTYLYKDQKKLETYFESKLVDLNKYGKTIENIYDHVKKLKTPVKTKKINLHSRKREVKKKRFLTEIVNLCKEYDLSLSHEDGHGAFLVSDYNESYSNWLLNADFEKE